MALAVPLSRFTSRVGGGSAFYVRRFRAMRLFWPLLILFQLWLASEIALPAFNAARGSYRHDERAAALKAMDEHPSPETKAAMQRELHLNAEHIMHQHFIQGGILLAVFFVLDVVGYYGWKNFRQSYGYKSPSA